MDKSKIFSKLLVEENLNERELTEIANLASKYIEIQKDTGDLFIKNLDSYPILDKVKLYLIGIWIVKEIGLSPDIDITNAFLSEKLGEKQTSLSGPLSLLVKNNIVKKDDITYNLNSFKVKSLLEEMGSSERSLVVKTKISQSMTSKKTLSKKNKSVKKRVSKPATENIFQNKLSENDIKNDLKKYGLNYDDLEQLFYIDRKGNLILSQRLDGNNKKEIHLKNTLLYLTGCKIFFDLVELDSSHLRRQLENMGVIGLVNLSTNLKKFNEYIIHKRGERGNTFTNYKLTNIGFNYGIKLIKDHIYKTQEFDLFKKVSPSGKKGTTSRKFISSFEISISEEDLRNNIEQFCEINEINKKKLLSNFELTSNNVRILFKINKLARAHKQVETLLYLGTVLKEIYKISKFDCEVLLKKSHQPYERIDLIYKNPTFKSCFSTSKHMREMELIYNGVETGKKMIFEVCKNGD